MKTPGGALLACLCCGWGMLCAAEPEIPSAASSTDAQWLEQVANLELHPRTREYAAQHLLAGGRGVLPTLLRGLHSQRSILRQVSSILLGELGEQDGEYPLLLVASSPDFIAGMHARKALRKLYTHLPPEALVRRARGELAALAEGESLSPGCRAVMAEAGLQAAAEIYGCEEAEALPEILESAAREQLQDAEPSVRTAAAGLLGLSGIAETPSVLLAHLEQEKDPAVLMEACSALAHLRPANGGEQVLPLAQHEDPRVRVEAMGALHGLGYGGVIPQIAKFLESQSQPLRLRAVEILGDSRDPAALEALGKATRDLAWRIRLEAVRALRLQKTPAMTGVLRSLLQDEQPQVRAEAAVLLHELEVPGAAWALVDDLQSAEMPYRLEAARALGRIRAGQGIRALTAALHDEDLELACRAAEALDRLRDPAAGRELLAALRDERPALRDLARKALRGIFGSDPGTNPERWPSWAERCGIR